MKRKKTLPYIYVLEVRKRKTQHWNPYNIYDEIDAYKKLDWAETAAEVERAGGQQTRIVSYKKERVV